LLRRGLCGTFAALCVIVGCGDGTPVATSACQPTEAAVLSVAEGLTAADNAHDVEIVLDHYADDIIFITPQGNLVAGKKAIRPRYERLFRDFVLDIQMEAEEVGLGGEWAFVRGRNVGTFTSRETDEVDPLEDRFLMILRCEPDAGWKVSRLMWVEAH
jgi:uncharacterized protein (TIGR02246 family)